MATTSIPDHRRPYPIRYMSHIHKALGYLRATFYKDETKLPEGVDPRLIYKFADESKSLTVIYERRAMVAHPDGKLYSWDVISGEHLWDIETGKKIYEADQTKGDGDFEYHIDIGEDGNFYKHHKKSTIQVTRLSYGAEELIREMRKVSHGRSMTVCVKTVVFVVDTRSGKIISTVNSDEDSSSKDSCIIPNDESIDDRQLIYVKRTDYELTYLSLPTQKFLWSLRFAEFEALSQCHCDYCLGRFQDDALEEVMYQLHNTVFRVLDLKKFGKLLLTNHIQVRPPEDAKINQNKLSKVGYNVVKGIQSFKYFAFEPRLCTLEDLMLSTAGTNENIMDFKVHKPNEYPSPEFFKLMRDIANEFTRLHQGGIFHRDLRPQNIMICKHDDSIREQSNLIESLLDMKCGSFTAKFFGMVDREKGKPKAADLCHHCLLWDPLKRLSFLNDASDYVKQTADKPVTHETWDKELIRELLTALTAYRTYEDYSVDSLLQVIRDTVIHYEDLSKEIHHILGEFPMGLESYFSSRFPKQLMAVHKSKLNEIFNVQNMTFKKKKGHDTEKRVGKLVVSKKKIGKGRDGTIVLKGFYDARPVAVKRIVPNDAFKDIQNLTVSDWHPNIVRCYGIEYDKFYSYIALERCICSLHDLIWPPTSLTRLQLKKKIPKDLYLWKPNGYPSPELLKLMRETVTGLTHLHELGIIHGDINPQSILICKDSCISAKVSYMYYLSKGATGYSSSGWQAPEQLQDEPETTRAVDSFSFGCLLFFCITRGHHPFGHTLVERETNILDDTKHLHLVENNPEAFDLISNLLNRDPTLRPTAAEVYHHPLFWDPHMRLSFLRDVSDYILKNHKTDSDLSEALERIGEVALGGKWDTKLDTILSNVGSYRKYKYDSVCDLLRFIRHNLIHYIALPEDIQAVLGRVPTEFDRYFSWRFPKLLVEVYRVLKNYGGEESPLHKYYGW